MMPSGTMTVSAESGRMRIVPCAGYENDGTIIVTYSFDAGIQKKYHPNPGARYESLQRIAYVPNNKQGKELVERLKYAFQFGLTFTIEEAAITWSSIPHKTNRSSCGAYDAFPDQFYLANCDTALNKLNVPSADEIMKQQQQQQRQKKKNNNKIDDVDVSRATTVEQESRRRLLSIIQQQKNKKTKRARFLVAKDTE